jgi:opacity protein-like surface antigen
VARPGESLGNILHDTDVAPNVLTTEPLPGDNTSPYQRKLFALTKTLVHRIEPAVLPGTLQLHHDGHGLYSATFNDTSKPGLYQLLLTYDFDAPDGSGRIRRIEQLERVLKVKPDASATNVVVIPGGRDQAGTFTVVVTPKDRFGNYMGPGAPGRISIAVNGVGTVSAISDPKQTGDYVATITGVPAGTVPDIHVTVDEVQVPVKSGSATFRIFLDAGPNFPTGDFDKVVDGRFSINAGLERFVAANTSFEAIAGYHAFKAPFVSNPRIWQLSVNVKQYFGPGPLHFFLNGGGGAYRFDPGNTTNFGWNAGAGVLYDVSPSWGVEGVYNFHSISPTDARFSTLQIGIRHWVF